MLSFSQFVAETYNLETVAHCMDRHGNVVRHYEIHHPEHGHVARMSATVYKDNPEHVELDLQALGGGHGAPLRGFRHHAGIGAVRSTLDQISKDFPNAKTAGGRRVQGASVDHEAKYKLRR